MATVVNANDTFLENGHVRLITDTVLSRAQKPAEILKWNTILGEFNQLQVQADNLGVVHTSFDAIYVTLYNYLNALNSAPAWTDLTVDTPYVGATFRSNFLNYYNAKASLQNAIAASAAQAQFSPFKTWEFRSTLDGWTANQSTVVLNADSVTITPTTTDPTLVFDTLPLPINGALYSKVRVRIRRVSGTGFQGELYYRTVSHTYEEIHSKIIPDTTSAVFSVIEFDMANLTTGGTDWITNTIIGLRFDFGMSTSDVFEIDWISIGKMGPVIIPPDSAIYNNLANLDFWVRDGALTWPTNGAYNRLVMTGTDVTASGPRGSNDVVWYCQENADNLQTHRSGGWDAAPVTLDPTKTHRFVVPIKHFAGTNFSAYWGAMNVADLNTTNASSNPYFANTGNTLVSGEWYLFIGFVFPSGSTGNTNDGSGVFRCLTGAQVSGGTNFNFLPGRSDVQHRAYQYYAELNSSMVFGRPLINVVNGTEPSLREYFASSALLNSAISIGADGSLGGAGGGQATLSGMGQKTFRVVAAGGASTTTPATPGIYKDGVLQQGAVRSYTVILITRTTGVIYSVQTFDVYGAGANTSGRDAGTMAGYLNSVASGTYIVVVYSLDEPQQNRLTAGLDAAMYRHGASRVVYGSTNFIYRSAYILVGISGCGEGNGAEAYQGAVANDVNAWCDIGFNILNGVLTGVSTSYTPKSLSDYSYVGDLNATYGATIGTNLGGQITPGNSATYIAALAIGSGQIADLRTTNYSEDGSANPTAGVKLSSTGTALKVANNAFQIGTVTFSDYWFRLVQGIDGSIGGGKVIWRGNNDATTRSGTPNISCLSVIPISDQLVQSNFQQTYHSYKLTPTSYTAYSDNLDAMSQIHVQFFQASTSTSAFTEFYQPCPSRTYDGVSGIVLGSWHWGWRYGGTGAVIGTSLETNNVYSGYLRIRIANTYGFSATQDFAPGSSINTALSTTTITGTAGTASYGGGSAGGSCPAPWVKVTLINGKEVNACDLHNGAVVAAVNDETMKPLPKGGVIRNIAVIWAQRYRIKLTDGSATEWSENHRFAVKGRGWVHVQHILPGDHILGLKECIVDTLLATGEGQVVSFEVEGSGTYFAGGLLCHNFKTIP